VFKSNTQRSNELSRYIDISTFYIGGERGTMKKERTHPHE
jgi:hypothetical protein